MISSDCVFGDWQVFFYCTQSEFFACLIGLAFFEPRDYRGVFVEQKTLKNALFFRVFAVDSIFIH